MLYVRIYKKYIYVGTLHVYSLVVAVYKIKDKTFLKLRISKISLKVALSKISWEIVVFSSSLPPTPQSNL